MGYKVKTRKRLGYDLSASLSDDTLDLSMNTRSAPRSGVHRRPVSNLAS